MWSFLEANGLPLPCGVACSSGGSACSNFACRRAGSGGIGACFCIGGRGGRGGAAAQASRPEQLSMGAGTQEAVEPPGPWLIPASKPRAGPSRGPATASGGAELWKDWAAGVAQASLSPSAQQVWPPRRFSAPPAPSPPGPPPPEQVLQAPPSRRRDSAPPPVRRSRRGVGEEDATGRVLLDARLAATIPISAGWGSTLPLPPSSSSWDWPLARSEKKVRILMIDRRTLIDDRKELEDELRVLRSLETQWV